LKIPQEQLPALEKIRTIPEKSLLGFAAALKSSPDTVPSIPELSAEDAERIKTAVTELYSVRSYFDIEVPQFVSAVAEALQEILHVDHTDDFKARLTKLLTIDSMNLTVKALSLKNEYEHIFCTARILTDARPVYGEDLTSPPPAVMIIHTLRISYHDESSRLREIYLAMDSDDIKALKEILDRAEAKSKSLQGLFGAAKVRVVASHEG